jgi:hypothetical protein
MARHRPATRNPSPATPNQPPNQLSTAARWHGPDRIAVLVLLPELAAEQRVIDVPAGQQSMLFYRAPAAASAPGSVGPNPQQPTNGIGLTLGICGAILLLALIPLIIAIAS